MNLEELFKEAFKNENLQSRFYYEILQNDIYILGEVESNGDVLEEGSEIKLVSLKNEGEVYIPVFLSAESMDIFLDGNEQEYIKAKGEDLLETLKQSNIVINPGQKDTMVLYADEVQLILSQGKN